MENEEKIYILTEQMLLSLLEDSYHLSALESYGVDNWTWYGDAIHEYIEEAIEDLPFYSENTQKDIEEENVSFSTLSCESLKDFPSFSLSELKTVVNNSNKIQNFLKEIE